MKKIFTIIALSLFSMKGISQQTYYWVGGTGPLSITNNNNWNTHLDGSGDARSVSGANDADVLIFDGSNIGGSTPLTGNVVVTTSAFNIGRLIFQNNANVKFSRTGAGSSNITILGDGTSADDLVLNAGSVLVLGDEIYNYNVRIVLGSSTVPATGKIEGTLYISPLSQTIHTASYITSFATDGLVFGNGSECHVTDSTTASPFNGSVTNSILFQSGSSLHYYSGRSPFGNSSTVQFANFEHGSNFYVKGSNVSYLDGSTAYASSSWANLKSFANVYIQNGATFRCDGPVYRIDDLTVDAGCSLYTHTSGYTPVLGNLTVNGTLSFVSGTNSLVMGGEVLQTISGTGTINIPNFVVADNSSVQLNKTITATNTANIVGNLNFGANGIIAGDAGFTSRVASSLPSGPGSTVAGSYQVSYDSPSSFTGYSISGPGIAPNTNIVGFGASANTIYISKPAISTQNNVNFDFTTDTALLRTANPNGFDETTGSVTVTGSRSFQSGTHYIIDAATVAPFGVSTAAGISITAGNVTLNAPVTTNYNTRIAGTLMLNNGNLTIRPEDTVRIMSGNAVVGAPFGSSKYIVSSRLGSNAGVLRIDDIAGSVLFPVGTAANYLPVNLTPATASDFAINVFEGATEDGSIDGTAMSASQKADMVDAIWTINRVNGSDDCSVTVQWTDGLEGSNFTSFPNSDIALSRYDGTQWVAATGNGDNSANTVTENFSEFSPFIVTKKSGTLPMQLKNIYATVKTNAIEISWQLLTNSDEDVWRYEVEKSTDRVQFNAVGLVYAAQQLRYSVLDHSAAAALQYYRLKIVYRSGQLRYSDVLVVRSNEKASLQVAPNPVANFINVSGLKNTAEIRIINSAGIVILRQQTTAGSISLPATKLAPGIYLLEAISNSGIRSTQRFIKL